MAKMSIQGKDLIGVSLTVSQKNEILIQNIDNIENYKALNMVFHHIIRVLPLPATIKVRYDNVEKCF